MGEKTSIAWTDATFNPWLGCAKVHEGCTHCYAEALSRAAGVAAFVKQIPSHDPDEWPEVLRIRKFPKVKAIA